MLTRIGRKLTVRTWLATLKESVREIRASNPVELSLRSCRGQTPASTSGRRFEFRCELCTLGYDSQSGLSQHMRARYPEEFHRRLKVEDNRKRKEYEDAELITLAEAEVDLLPDTGYINKALAALGRTE